MHLHRGNVAVLLEASAPTLPKALLPLRLSPGPEHSSAPSAFGRKRDSLLPGTAFQDGPGCSGACHLLLPCRPLPGLHLRPPNPPPLSPPPKVSFRNLQVPGVQRTREGSDLRGGAQGVPEHERV